MHKSSSSSAKHNPWKGVIGPALRGQRNAAAELFRTDTEDGIFDISAFLSHAEHLLDRAAMNWFAEATGTESVEDRAFTLDTLLLDSVQKLKPFYETVAEVNASTEDAIARQVRKGLTLRIQAWKSNAFKRVLKEEIATQSKYVTPRKRASQEHAARLSNAERLDAGVPSLVKDHPQAHAGAPTAFELQDPCSVSVGDKRYSLTPLAGEIVKVLNDDLQQNKSGVS